jgi:hypothetical protein
MYFSRRKRWQRKKRVNIIGAMQKNGISRRQICFFIHCVSDTLIAALAGER